ncbi:ATP-binding cassette domain-containing protein [Rhodanobacter lindaniclasticus]
MFQGFNLFPALNAFEQVELPLNHMGLSREEPTPARAAVAGGGWRPAHRPCGCAPSELSGGEKQRVAIARALAKQPDCCSPTSRPARWTPPTVRSSSTSCISMARHHGTTVLCVSHDPRLGVHADRV